MMDADLLQQKQNSHTGFTYDVLPLPCVSTFIFIKILFINGISFKH